MPRGPGCARAALGGGRKTWWRVQAVPSWFVSVESIRARVLACNEETYWVPAYVKEKRFANWLEGARDWAVSRSRYWGTPLPIWESDDGEERVVVSSVEQLYELTGAARPGLRRRGRCAAVARREPRGLQASA